MWHKKEKILVTYATKCGSTCEVAEAIGKVLRDKGLDVDVFPVKGVVDVSHYNAVVIGSGVRVGKLYADVVNFVKKNKEKLKKMPVAYFIDSLTMSVETQKNRETAKAYLDPLRRLVPPVEVGVFAGKVEFKKLSAPARLALKLMRIKEGDYRKWDIIKRWAEELPKKLKR